MPVVPFGSVVVVITGTVGAGVTVTDNVRSVPLPQLLLGVTEIVPPAVPAVTVMLLVVPPAVFVQPVGNDQLYVTPDTLVTE